MLHLLELWNMSGNMEKLSLSSKPNFHATKCFSEKL